MTATVIVPPVNSERHNLYNEDIMPAPPWETLDYGHVMGIPQLIPRQWSENLRYMAGALQHGARQTWDTLRLPSSTGVPVRRGMASIQLALGNPYGMSADRVNVPAIFIGWNPDNAR